MSQFIPPFMDLATLARHICAGEATIERWVKEGLFPGPRRKIKGKNLWRWKDVEDHLAEGGSTSTPFADRKPGDITHATRAATSRR